MDDMDIEEEARSALYDFKKVREDLQNVSERLRAHVVECQRMLAAIDDELMGSETRPVVADTESEVEAETSQPVEAVEAEPEFNESVEIPVEEYSDPVVEEEPDGDLFDDVEEDGETAEESVTVDLDDFDSISF